MADSKTPKTAAKAKADAPKSEPKAAKADVHKARIQPQLTDAQKTSLGARKLKDQARPAFRRHEWWRYIKLGGKNAPWRVPSGIHSKVRRHYNYRPPVVSIGYRGPEAVRGLHPSGFAEVIVHTPAELSGLDKATQAARIGGTVGGRKAELIEKKAAELGIRVLNPRTTGGDS